MRVYVSHPLRGNVEANRRRVDEICRRISEEHPDVTILSPIHNFGYVSPAGPQEWVLSQCRGLLHAADELWLFGEWERSEGCLMELACALEMGIPVRHIALRRQLKSAKKRTPREAGQPEKPEGRSGGRGDDTTCSM